MKLNTKTMVNTERRILDILTQCDRLSAASIVRMVYPHSKQIERKAKTYSMHLRSLERRGLVRSMPTPSGVTWMIVSREVVVGHGDAADPARGLRLAR